MKLVEAIQEILKGKKRKFVETIDLSIRLNINPKKPDQCIRETSLLPHPIPKEIKLLVIDDSLTSEEVTELGITHYGSNEMIEKIQAGWMDFNLIITTTKMMPKVLKLGKLLGPKGLMPNTKSGTVTNDLKRTIIEFQKGKTEFKNDSFGNLHIPIGKIDFDPDKLSENYNYIMGFLKQKKPVGVKTTFIKKIFISSTMGKSYEVDLIQ